MIIYQETRYKGKLFGINRAMETCIMKTINIPNFIPNFPYSMGPAPLPK